MQTWNASLALPWLNCCTANPLKYVAPFAGQQPSFEGSSSGSEKRAVNTEQRQRRRLAAPAVTVTVTIGEYRSARRTLDDNAATGSRNEWLMYGPLKCLQAYSALKILDSILSSVENQLTNYLCLHCSSSKQCDTSKLL
eukprot:scpid86159/ scgid6026/ 